MPNIVRFVFKLFSLNLTRRSRPSISSFGAGLTFKKKALSADRVFEALGDLPKAKVVHVIDGDTLVFAKGWRRKKVRLDSIDCPEDGQPWGNIATAGLIKLVGGRTIILEEHGLAIHGRTL